jgi:primary-amine oxidase
MELHISPVDFFTENPAIDVPSSKNNESKLTNGCCAQPKL